MTMDVTPGTFEQSARRSARNATLRNGAIVLTMLASATLWISDAAKARESGLAIAVVILESLIAGLATWRVLVALSRLRDVLKHPIFRDFAPYGDPRSLVLEIEQAVSSGAGRCIANLVITDNFLVKRGFGHAVVRFDDIAWTYLKQTRHSVNFIPVGVTRSVELFTFSSAHRWYPLSLDVDSTVLDSLKTHAHRARFGFSLENEAWWHETRVSLAKGV